MTTLLWLRSISYHPTGYTQEEHIRLAPFPRFAPQPNTLNPKACMTGVRMAPWGSVSVCANDRHQLVVTQTSAQSQEATVQLLG